MWAVGAGSAVAGRGCVRRFGSREFACPSFAAGSHPSTRQARSYTLLRSLPSSLPLVLFLFSLIRVYPYPCPGPCPLSLFLSLSQSLSSFPLLPQLRSLLTVLNSDPCSHMNSCPSPCNDSLSLPLRSRFRPSSRSRSSSHSHSHSHSRPRPRPRPRVRLPSLLPPYSTSQAYPTARPPPPLAPVRPPSRPPSRLRSLLQVRLQVRLRVRHSGSAACVLSLPGPRSPAPAASGAVLLANLPAYGQMDGSGLLLPQFYVPLMIPNIEYYTNAPRVIYLNERSPAPCIKLGPFPRIYVTNELALLRCRTAARGARHPPPGRPFPPAHAARRAPGPRRRPPGPPPVRPPGRGRRRAPGRHGPGPPHRRGQHPGPVRTPLPPGPLRRLEVSVPALTGRCVGAGPRLQRAHGRPRGPEQVGPVASVVSPGSSPDCRQVFTRLWSRESEGVMA